jgi:uncharacterized protein YcgI (DUF1989 family)
MQQQLRAAAPQQLAVRRVPSSCARAASRSTTSQRRVQPCRAAAAAPAGLQVVPAYKGAAVRVKKGELLKVVNTHGQQVRAPALRRTPPPVQAPCPERRAARRLLRTGL